MSNIIPPLISTSPPPLDFTMDSDEEDEFRPPLEDDSYSCDESVFPNDLPEFDIPEMDINRNKKEHKDFHDKRKSDEGSEYNSDAILPNIQEIVPNINRHNDDLRNDIKKANIFDSEDIEVALVTHNVNGLIIPKEAEPITTPSVDEIVNHVHSSGEFDAKGERNINSPTEIVLNTELIDKAISDKELSSSEPNFESCSDNSLKGHENNDTNASNKVQDKSISDVDELDDDYGDFADFNNVSSCNFTQVAEDSENEHLKSLSKIVQINNKTPVCEEIITQNSINIDLKREYGKDCAESINIVNTENILNNQNSSPITLDIYSQTPNTSTYTINTEKITRIDNSTEYESRDCRDEDHDVIIPKTTSLVSKNGYEAPATIYESDIVYEPYISIYEDDAEKTFSSINVKSTEPPQILQLTFNDSDDEFGEFDSCTAAPIPQEQRIEETQDQPLTALYINRNNVHERSKETLEMMFPGEIPLENDFLQDEYENNSIFSKIKNLTETNALTYQWSKSNSQQTLLKVLNIDIRNILYGPGWNSTMPIFAANLSSAPLEPQKTNLPTITTSTSNDLSMEPSVVCDTQFDWASSGLTNPLETTNQKDISLKESSLGEPAKSFDTESVNSLQFTEVINENIDDKSVTITDLQEFDHFTDFQTVKTAQTDSVPPTAISASNAMFPLRETYINLNNLEVETKQSINMNTIIDPVLESVSPEFGSPTTGLSNSRTDDDFTEFQASLPEITLMDSKQSTNRSIEYKLAIENPIEPELLRNTKLSSKVLQPVSEVLQPTIMQTFKVGHITPTSSTVNIDWPDPGITDDEIRKFEEYSYSKSEKVEKAHVPTTNAKAKPNSKSAVVVPKQAHIDDEWSDFQDAAKELPLSIASLGKIAQNQALSQQRHVIGPVIAQTSILKQDLWQNTYQQNTGTIHNHFFPAQTKVQPPQPVGVKQTLPLNLGRGDPQIRFDQTTSQYPAPHTRQVNSNEDEWSDFVCHQPPIPNFNHRQEDWTIRGPQFNSWTSTSLTPNIATSTSNPNTLQFNGFNSFGRSGSILNSTAKSVGSVQGKNKGGALVSGVSSKRESVPSISALPDLDFATSASRFSSSRLQQQKK